MFILRDYTCWPLKPQYNDFNIYIYISFRAVLNRILEPATAVNISLSEKEREIVIKLKWEKIIIPFLGISYTLKIEL